jgi:CubicO group peptidase (beta-lactamase class C family)
MDARARVSGFSGAVLVAVNGNPVYRDAFGPANRDLDVPNTPRTKFRIGSVTKQFTAAAILLLEERGELKTSDPLKAHLPDCPPAWADVTIHQLLSHTGGVPEHTTPLLMLDFGKLARPYTPERIVELVKDKPLDFAPGEKWRYSNTGYVLLGWVIETVSKRDYAAFMRENVFDPLGMADTGVEKAGEVLRHRATGYEGAGASVRVARHLHMSLPHAAGAMYSTVDDLLKWDRALAGHRLLSPGSAEKLFTAVKDDYAYGFGVTRRFGLRVQEHGGGIPGFVSRVCRYPDAGVFVAVLRNADGPPPTAVANELAAIVLGEACELPRERTPGKPDPAALDAVAGEYRRGDETLAVARAGDRVEFRVGTGAATGLTFESPGRFYAFSPRAEIDARFETTGDAATRLVLRRDGVETRWERAK